MAVSDAVQKKRSSVYGVASVIRQFLKGKAAVGGATLAEVCAAAQAHARARKETEPTEEQVWNSLRNMKDKLMVKFRGERWQMVRGSMTGLEDLWQEKHARTRQRRKQQKAEGGAG